MLWKFVSSGQNVDDAKIVTQTLLGESLKALTPVNLRMYRSPGLPGGYTNNKGSIGFEWTRRSRIAPGLRPYSDVPFGEELIRYEVEIMNGADVVRTIFVDEDDFTPLLWYVQANNFLGVAIDFDETLLGNSSLFGIVVSRQIFNVGSDDIQISFTFDTTTAPSHIGLIPASLITTNISKVTPVIGFERYLGSTTTTTMGLATNVNLVANTNARLIIKVNRSGYASLHQDSGGQLTPPLGGRTVTLTPGLYCLMVKNGINSGGDEYCRLLGANQRRLDSPGAYYSLNDATADFGGALPATLTIRVYQISPVIGRGPYKEATFTL